LVKLREELLTTEKTMRKKLRKNKIKLTLLLGKIW